ncbi:hypothetical protein Tco_1384230 [Tanacetum coccineum]
MVTLDGEGVDWTGHAEDEQENFALMAYSNSGSNTEVTSYSKECVQSYAKLKKLYDEQREQLGDASIEIQAYTQALKKVEAQLVAHQKNQLWYEEKIRFMKIDLDDKTDVLTYHKKLLAEAVKEKEELKTKLENFQSSSKGLSKLLNSQMSTRDKSGLGYGNQIHEGVLSYEKEVLESVFDSRSSDVEDSHVYDRFAKVEGMHAVPPPMTGNYMPPKSDFGIDESNFTYGPKQSKTSESDAKTSESDAKTSDFDYCKTNSSVETLESVHEPVVVEPKVDSDDEYVIEPSKEQEKPSFAFVNTVKHVKTPRETVKEQNTCSPSPKVNKRDWNGSMSKRLGLGYGFTKKAFNIARQNPFSQAAETSTATKVNTARQNPFSQAAETSTTRKVNTARPIVNEIKLRNKFYKFHSPIRRPKTITKALLGRIWKWRTMMEFTLLPNIEIFEQLALMGYATDSDKLTFQKDIPLFPSMITAPETSPSRITSSPSLSPQHTPVSAPSTSPPPITETTPTAEEPAPMPHESPLQTWENELTQTKKVYGSAITKLVKRVKKLEKQVKTGKARRRTKIVLSEDETVEEDSSKQVRSLIEELDMDADISLVPPHDAEIQEKISDDNKVSTAAANLVYIRRSAEKRKDKGKAIMIEDESVQKKSKKQLEKERLSHKEVIRLQEQIDEEERKRIARDAKIAKQLQEEYDKAGKKDVVTEVDTAHVIDWNDPSVIRYHALQNRPRSVAEVRKNMIMYLKNQGGYKMKDFKGMSYDDIRPIFEKVWDQMHSFVPMDSEEEVQRLKRAGQDVETKPAKRQRTEEVSESVQKQTDEEPKTDELSQEQLNQMVIIVPDEGINVEALQTKYLIIRWEVYSKDIMQFWKIIRVGNYTEVYQVFEDMLKNFDRMIWSI